MNHYVYKITNILNGKIYIGKRSFNGNVEDDKYMGSSKYLNQDIKKYGKDNFKKEILAVFDNEIKALWTEKDFINEFIYEVDMYNLNPGGSGLTKASQKNTKGKSKNISISLENLLDMEDYCKDNNMTFSDLIVFLWNEVKNGNLDIEKFQEELDNRDMAEEYEKMFRTAFEKGIGFN